MKLERDILDGRKTEEGRRPQHGGGFAQFPDDLVSVPLLVNLLVETIQRDGKGGLNHKFRGKAVRLLVGMMNCARVFNGGGPLDGAFSDVVSAAVFSIAGTEGCSLHKPAGSTSLVNISGRLSPFRVKRLKEMSAHKDFAGAIIATKSAAEIDIGMHSSVERFFLPPEDVFMYLVFNGEKAVLRWALLIRLSAAIEAALHTGQYVKEVAAGAEAACVQKRCEKHHPADHLSKLHFLKWKIGNPLSGNKDYRGCVRKRDLGGAGSSDSREATGTMVGRGTEPPDEQPIVGSQHVGSLQGGLPHEHHGILSKMAMSAAWLEFVTIR